jgi:hypothetical protein
MPPAGSDRRNPGGPGAGGAAPARQLRGLDPKGSHEETAKSRFVLKPALPLCDAAKFTSG